MGMEWMQGWIYELLQPDAGLVFSHWRTLSHSWQQNLYVWGTSLSQLLTLSRQQAFIAYLALRLSSMLEGYHCNTRAFLNHR